MVEQTNGAISQAPGRKEECRRDSLVVFEYLSPIMIFYSYFPKQMDPYEWHTFPGSSSLQHPVRHSQPLDLFYYYENPVLISPQLFPGLWPSCPCVRKANWDTVPPPATSL